MRDNDFEVDEALSLYDTYESQMPATNTKGRREGFSTRQPSGVLTEARSASLSQRVERERRTHLAPASQSGQRTRPTEVRQLTTLRGPWRASKAGARLHWPGGFTSRWCGSFGGAMVSREDTCSLVPSGKGQGKRLGRPTLKLEASASLFPSASPEGLSLESPPDHQLEIG